MFEHWEIKLLMTAGFESWQIKSGRLLSIKFNPQSYILLIHRADVFTYNSCVHVREKA